MQRHIYKYYCSKTGPVREWKKLEKKAVLQIRSAAPFFDIRSAEISKVHKNVFICKKESKL